MPMLFPEEFRPVCRYVMKNGKPSDIQILDQELWQQSGVVYARTCEGKVVYIGTADGRLSRRIGAHLNIIANSARDSAARYRKWAEGKQITIVAYRPTPVMVLGREVKIHRALEAALIVEFRRRNEEDWFVRRT
jgi:hypothetical protein